MPNTTKKSLTTEWYKQVTKIKADLKAAQSTSNTIDRASKLSIIHAEISDLLINGTDPVGTTNSNEMFENRTWMGQNAAIKEKFGEGIEMTHFQREQETPKSETAIIQSLETTIDILIKQLAPTQG